MIIETCKDTSNITTFSQPKSVKKKFVLLIYAGVCEKNGRKNAKFGSDREVRRETGDSKLCSKVKVSELCKTEVNFR